MRAIFIIGFLLFYSVTKSQTPHQHWKWAKSFGGSSLDSSVDMKLNNGFLYITGVFTSSQINWENTLLNNDGGKDIFLAKLDTNGNTIWAKRFGGTADDIVSQLEMNSSGLFVLRCSSLSNSVTIDNTVITNPDNFYVEFDQNGNLLNAVVLPSDVFASDIDIDYSGAIYTGVTYLRPFTFANTLIDTSLGGKGAAILKFDNSGSSEWGRYISLLGPRVGLARAPLIEYSDFDSSINLMWCHGYEGAILFGLNFWSTSTTENIYSKISSSGNALNVKKINAGSLGLNFSDFETGRIGLEYSMTRRLLLSGNLIYTVNKWYNILRVRSTDFAEIDSFAGEPNGYVRFPFIQGTLKVNESGGYALVNHTKSYNWGNSDSYNNIIELLDSNLNRTIKANIIDTNSRSWNVKCMNDSFSIYFTNSYKTAQLILNENIPLASSFTLLNNGISNIFIGKCGTGIVPFVYITIRNGVLSDPSTWLEGRVPISNSDVVVRHNLTINEDFILNSLKVVAPGSVTIQSGITLTILH